jgi:hypothetical protein
VRVDLKEECRTAQPEIKMSTGKSFLSRRKDALAELAKLKYAGRN